MVVLGLQYAVLAKWVNGLKTAICAEVSAVILCLLENSTVAGAAFADRAQRSAEKVSPLLISISLSGRAEIQQLVEPSPYNRNDL